MNTLRRTLTGWLELVRPPNLFTVPGDPLVGFILTGGGDSGLRPAGLVALAATLLYMAGLIWNDCADAAEDRHSRALRPIPSGRVKRAHAFAVACVLAAGGAAIGWQAGTAAGWTSLLLVGLILAYNFAARAHVATGVITMGLCRGASVMLGAAAARDADPALAGWGLLPWFAAGGIALYVVAVSVLAHGETRRLRLGVRPWLPLAAVVLLFAASGQTNAFSAGLAAVAVVCLAMRAWALRGVAEPVAVQRSIGFMIRILLLIQAGLCALMPETGLLPAMLLLAAWPGASFAGRQFYGS